MSFAIVAPGIDYAGLSPLLALVGGIVVVLATGIVGGRVGRHGPWIAALLSSVATFALAVWQFGPPRFVLEGALRIDDLGMTLMLTVSVSAAVAVMLSVREPDPVEAGRSEYFALILTSALGMGVLGMAENIVSFFIGLETLSIPLYILCASRVTVRVRLESGFKYLIVGSAGSAVLLFGLAMLYGATGFTDFGEMSRQVEAHPAEPLGLLGMAMVAGGLCFKASLAPFHQWTPDVYQGAPTPITTFMSVATKAAAFVALLRIFDIMLGPLHEYWGPALGFIGVLSMVVGNVGAIGQDSLKRIMGYSGIAQAGYVLTGVAVATRAGASSVVFYLLVYVAMNVSVFAVIAIRERETILADSIDSLRGLGRSRPLLAGAVAVSMLSLAGFPGTAGFFGKFFLIEAAIGGAYLWMAIGIALATAISLVYYLRIVAVMWMKPALAADGLARRPVTAGEAPEVADGEPQFANPAMPVLAIVAAAATIFFGIMPQPLLDLAKSAGSALF